jgi:hypothetical protein
LPEFQGIFGRIPDKHPEIRMNMSKMWRWSTYPKCIVSENAQVKDGKNVAGSIDCDLIKATF